MTRSPSRLLLAVAVAAVAVVAVAEHPVVAEHLPAGGAPRCSAGGAPPAGGAAVAAAVAVVAVADGGGGGGSRYLHRQSQRLPKSRFHVWRLRAEAVVVVAVAEPRVAEHLRTQVEQLQLLPAPVTFTVKKGRS